MLFVLTVVLICLHNPKLGPAGPRTTMKEKILSLGGIIEAIILFAATIGGLFAGFFSPTQAGAIGAFGAFFIGLFRGKLKPKKTVDAIRDGLRTSAMVLFIITGAAVFGHFLAISGIPFVLADWVGNLPIPPMGVMAVMVFIYFIGGFFMDSMALIVVTIPIFYPIVQRFNFDPIWFGVIVVMIGEMGVITPPVGVNVFVIKGIAPGVPLEKIYRGILPFLVAIIVLTILLMIFPQIATFLPNLIH